MDNKDSRLVKGIGFDTTVLKSSLFGCSTCTDMDELEAQVAFLGAPYEMGQRRPGSRFGPDGLRAAQVYRYAGRQGQGQSEAAGYYDFKADRKRLAGVTMADCGDVALTGADVDRDLRCITHAVRSIVTCGSLPVVIGGDHSITAALVRGFDAYPAIDIVQFDAHLDFNDDEGSWSCSTPLRRCSEFPWVGKISHVGLHGFGNPSEAFQAADARGNCIIMADQFRDIGPEAAIGLIPESDAMYVTIDVDALDPSICPGTGSTEPGGLTYLEMRGALRALARRGRIAGIDVVEVAPPLDLNGITSKIAGNLIIDFLSAIFNEQELPAVASRVANRSASSPARS